MSNAKESGYCVKCKRFVKHGENGYVDAVRCKTDKYSAYCFSCEDKALENAQVVRLW